MIDKINIINIVLYLYVAAIGLCADGSIIIKISRLLIVGITLIYIIKSKKIYIDYYVKWAAIFSIYVSFSVYWALSRPIAISGALTVIFNSICVTCIIILTSNSEKIFYNILKVIFGTAVIYGLMIFVKYGFFVFINQRHIDNLSANDIGIHSALGTIIGLILIMNGKCKVKSIYILGIIVNITWIVLSASRKSLFLLVIPLVIYFIGKSKRTLNIIVNILIISISIIAVYECIIKIDFLYNFIGNRIETMISGVFMKSVTDGSTQFRLSLIEWGIEWFKSKPILGYGINNFRYLLGFKNTWAGSSGTYAHNNFIELAVDGGLVGFIIYYSLYFKIIISALKKISHNNKNLLIILGMIIGIFVNEYGLVTYNEKYIQLLIGVIWISIQGNIINFEIDNTKEVFIVK